MKRLFLSVAALLTFAAVVAQPGAQQIPVIPADKEVRTGTLENGMKYYLRHNAKQKNLADFHIVHDVGAIQEADDQQGLAHFLEHMAFNGTKNLPGKMLIEYLETVGVKFGANLNAGTSWDYTEYLMKDVPTIRPGIIDSAMLILHDWSHFIALQPTEIDSERGVIMEELRTRDGASWRSTIQMLKALCKGTKYEHRNLIGHLDGLKSFDHTSLQNFYKKWYRPEFQAVVIVGDINVDEVEAKLKKLMADIPASPADAAQKEVITIPDNQEPIVSIFEDAEMMENSATIFIKRAALPKEYNNTVVYEQISLINSLVGNMFKTRLTEIAMKPNAPFTTGDLMNGSIGICPTADLLGLSINTADGKLAAGIEAAYTELERVRRHGFTEGELERARQTILRREEQAYNNRNDRKNAMFVRRYISAFRNNTPMPDAETEWQLDSMLISQIPLKMINQVMQQYITPHNKVIVINCPKKDGVVNPTEADVKAILTKVDAAEVAPYADNTVKVPLIANPKALKGSKVKSESKNEALGATEWTLKNGVKVVVKPTTFKADEVFVNGEAHFGKSSLTDEQYWSGFFYGSIMRQMGVSQFSATELRKQLSGKSASASTGLDDYSATIEGAGSPKDMETILQLIYLQCTDPRFSEEDFTTTIKQYEAMLANIDSNPDYIAGCEIVKTMYNNHPRRQQLSMDILKKVKFEHMKQIHNTFFTNAANYTFYIVGNVDLTTLKPLVEKYIGSLPVSKKLAKKVDDGVRMAKGVVEKDFRAKMQQPKVSVTRIYSGDIENTLKNRIAMSVLSQALRSRYTISIREEKGGTYGVQVGGEIDPDYTCHYQLFIQFDTNEAMADELSAIVVKEIEKIAKEGPLSEDIEKARQYMLKEWKNRLEQNGNWLSWLDSYYGYGLDRVSTYEKLVSEFTAADIQALAQKIIKDNNIAYVVMRPEK